MPVPYNAKVHFQQGSSELHFLAGGSATFDAGGVLNNPNINGSVVLPAATLLTMQSGASVNFNVTGPSGTAFTLINGASTPSFYTGMDAPTFVAPMGSIYIRASGSVSGLYWNKTQDASGSTWQLAASG